jgi:hypothetical protein
LKRLSSVAFKISIWRPFTIASFSQTAQETDPARNFANGCCVFICFTSKPSVFAESFFSIPEEARASPKRGQPRFMLPPAPPPIRIPQDVDLLPKPLNTHPPLRNSQHVHIFDVIEIDHTHPQILKHAVLSPWQSLAHDAQHDQNVLQLLPKLFRSR